MRKWFREMAGLAMAASAGLGAFWGIWFIWGSYIRELFTAVQYVTTHAMIWGGAAGLLVAGAVHLMGKRYVWLGHSIYYVVANVTSGKLKAGAEGLNGMFGSNDRRQSFLSMYVFNMSDHWLAQKVEEWALRILYVLFWPVVIVGATHSFQDDVSTAGGYALTILVIVLIFSLFGAKLYNLALFIGIAVWLSYVGLKQGGIESEAQAVVIGFGFVLWAGWREWQRRITYPIERGRDDDEGPAPEPTQ